MFQSRSFLSMRRRILLLPSAFRNYNSDGIKVIEFGVEKTPITQQLWEARQQKSVTSATPLPSQSLHLVAKSPSSSRITVSYPFCDDPKLRDLYIDTFGNILLGKLLEDLDALAGNISRLHLSSGDESVIARFNLVTASVDKIVQNTQLSIKENYTMTGQVAWVGRSSLDVAIELHIQKKEPKDAIEGGGLHQPVMYDKSSSTRVLSSIFTYVARDAHTGKAAAIGGLVCEPESRELVVFAQRSALAQSRKVAKAAGGEAVGDVATKQRETVTQLVDRGRAMGDMPALAQHNAVLMSTTGLENCFVCQPQNVNTAGRVFGGFLLHKAFDLALATGYTFAGVYPRFLEVDDVVFKKPVDIGDMIRLKSRVIYSSDSDPIYPTVQIEVTCQVMKPERASSVLSNTFNFVFGFDHAVTLRRVLPTTAEEAHKLIAASQWVQDNVTCSNIYS